MAYDRMDWHYGSDNFPDDLEPENGGTHIGMFLAWVINNHLEGELHVNESQESLARVCSRQMTGREFLEQECDEKFWEVDLNEEGNAFAKYYYDSDKYIDDYVEIFCDNFPSIYHVEDIWENYDKIAKVLDKRFNEWKRQKNKKLWEIWK